MKKLLFLAFLLIFGCAGIKKDNSITETHNYTINRSMDDLPTAISPTHIYLENGSTYNLDSRIVKKELSNVKFRSYSYNGMISGPIFHVKQGSSVYFNFTNKLDMDTTVHWHGIRLDNQYDGVPHITQEPITPNESFLYKIDFPDYGVYWYHPHIREDLQQELGMYGVILVDPNNESLYNKVDKEEVLVLDDILLSKTDIEPFYKNTNYALMGRFGNTLMINGETNYTLKVKKGQIVRFFILNSANVRPFNFSISETKLKIVGSDNGRYQNEFFADSLIITPSERYIFESQFDKTGEFEIRNNNPLKNWSLGKIIVEINDSEIPQNNFSSLRTNYNSEEFSKYLLFDKKPDIDYELNLDVKDAMMMGDMMMHGEEIEWEDTMPVMNRNSNNSRVKWQIIDKSTSKSNMDASRTVELNKPIKIRINNPSHSMHPMQHTFHLHGARFLVLDIDGKKTNNPVWKDSVNIPSGSYIDIVTIFEKPGEWMMHCHIAEHLSSDMMSSLIAK